MSKVGVKKMAPRCDNCGKQGKIVDNSGGQNWCKNCVHLAPGHNLEIPVIPPDPGKTRFGITGEGDGGNEG